jgi:tRNA pseudouridine55 synthase
LNVYKLPGPTSHDVVARLRRHLKKVRVGHSGTLDPLAEGVLLLCLGRATKFFDFLIECPKTYIATLRLGIVTTTQDTEGDIVSERPVGPVSAEAWRELLKEFEGEIEQLPPMFSARRHQGRHLYDLARAGIEVERAPRRTWVEGLELLSIEGPEVTLKVRCGRGTYIRTLCQDLGERFQTGAHMARLTRTAVGPFLAEDSTSLEAAEDHAIHGTLEELLVPVARALACLPEVHLGRLPPGGLRKGMWIGEKDLLGPAPEGRAGTHLRLVDGAGQTLALARFVSGEAFPMRVRKVLKTPLAVQT